MTGLVKKKLSYFVCVDIMTLARQLGYVGTCKSYLGGVVDVTCSCGCNCGCTANSNTDSVVCHDRQMLFTFDLVCLRCVSYRVHVQ
jgi:hypothetical protein